MVRFTGDDIKAICCFVCASKIEIETRHLVGTIHHVFKSCFATSMGVVHLMIALLSSSI